jgi:hypothetical protein
VEPVGGEERDRRLAGQALAVDGDPDPQRVDVDGVAAEVDQRHPAVGARPHLERRAWRRLRRVGRRRNGDAGHPGQGDRHREQEGGADDRRDAAVAPGHAPGWSPLR